MGKAVASQHPSVVLRSHYRLVRALLAVAMIAVIGLSIAVVMLATDGDEVTDTNAARPTDAINYRGFNPATGRPESAPLPQRETQSPSTTRYDGGPEEGTRGIRQSDQRAASPAGPQAIRRLYERELRRFGFTPEQAANEALPHTRYDGGPE
jgi:hypothetical protein